MNRPSQRPLRAVPPAHGGEETVFCGYCGHRAPGTEPAAQRTRVCAECELGLLLAAERSVAPRETEPFLVLDDALMLRAMSRAAEALFELSESEALRRTVSDLLVPADSISHDPLGLIAALSLAIRGGAPGQVVVRRPGQFGVRYAARIGACRPGPAALVVLERM